MLCVMFLTFVMTQAVSLFIRDTTEFVGLTNIIHTKLITSVDVLSVNEPLALNLSRAITLAGLLLFALWLFCLICAGAALSYEEESTVQKSIHKTDTQAPRLSTEDISALRRARMPSQNK